MDEQQPPEKKKRKKPFAATAYALKECRKRGYLAQVVEQNIRIPGGRTFKRDLFGVIDIVCITPKGLLGIQATSGDNHASRVAKIIAEPNARAWIAAGQKLEVWSFARHAGSRRWDLRVETIRLEDFRIAQEAA